MLPTWTSTHSTMTFLPFASELCYRLLHVSLSWLAREKRKDPKGVVVDAVVCRDGVRLRLGRRLPHPRSWHLPIPSYTHALHDCQNSGNTHGRSGTWLPYGSHLSIGTENISVSHLAFCWLLSACRSCLAPFHHPQGYISLLYLSKRSLSIPLSSGLSGRLRTIMRSAFCMMVNLCRNCSGPVGTLSDDDAFLTVRLPFESQTGSTVSGSTSSLLTTSPSVSARNSPPSNSCSALANPFYPPPSH